MGARFQRAFLFLREWARVSSGLAAKWAGQPRADFLLKALTQGARLLDQADADYRRESSL